MPESKREAQATNQPCWLVGIDELARGARHPLNGPVLVGRGKYNHIVLDDSRISRQHARVTPEAAGYVVYDLNSVNGTFVNGAAVSRLVLQPNDLVSFGPYVFRLDESPPEALDVPVSPDLDEPTRNTLEDPESMVSGISRADLGLELPESPESPDCAATRETIPVVESPMEARLRHDLALAAQIQKSFLPREVIAVEGLDLFAEYRAAYSVGGDFYDVFWVGPDRLAVFIGDISGKGIAGALLMARISSELRAAALAHVEPVAVLSAMNKATIERGQPELFFTAIYLTLDVKTGEISLANAGHPTPYACRAGGIVEPITAGRSCPVGILDDPGFVAAPLRLDHGDTLILYTDGVVEAAGDDGSLYGQDRLEACLATAGVRPRAIAERILESVEAHSTRRSANDDLTLFLCQRSAETARTMQPRSRSSSFPAPTVNCRA